MREVTKGSEPAALTAHRQTPHCDYGNYARKDELRQALVSEQRGLCCYCMARIRNGPTNMKIEHWHCQEQYPTEQLTYRNLLGACLGGDREPEFLQHCDTRKGNRELRWNPADPNHHIETRIRYEFDGTIRSDDSAFDLQLDSVLNLNLPVLKKNRKNVLDAVLEWWKRENDRIHGTIPRYRLERERNRYVTGNDELAPYCQVVVWWLGKKLARMTE